MLKQCPDGAGSLLAPAGEGRKEGALSVDLGGKRANTAAALFRIEVKSSLWCCYLRWSVSCLRLASGSLPRLHHRLHHSPCLYIGMSNAESGQRAGR